MWLHQVPSLSSDKVKTLCTWCMHGAWWHFSCVFSSIGLKIKSKYFLDHLFLNLICKKLHLFLGIVSFSCSLPLLKRLSLLQRFVMRVWRGSLILECILLDRPFSYPTMVLNQASNCIRCICTWEMSWSQAQTLARSGAAWICPEHCGARGAQVQLCPPFPFIRSLFYAHLVYNVLVWQGSSAVCTPGGFESAEQHFKAMRDRQEHLG